MMARAFCAALCVAVFAFVYSFPVAASGPKAAAGLVCDTAEQAAMFGSLYDSEGAESALAKVNEDAKDPLACMVAQFVYIGGKRGAGVKADGKDWVVTEILIIGINTPMGMQQVPPKVFYTLLPAEGRPA